MTASTVTELAGVPDTVPLPPEGAVPTMRAVAPPPVARRPGRTRGYWGVLSLIATEATLFTGLLATYYFLRASSPVWPQGGIKPPELTTISVFSAILIGSSLPVLVAESAIKRGNARAMRVGLALAFLMGSAFLAHEGYEWSHLEFNWTRNAYTSIFYATTGLHGMHVLIGLLVNLQVQVKSWMGKIDREHHVSMEIFGLYWHFVDVVWIFVFSSLYLSEHIR
ncbi:MAG TPA: cytochrome c oxidase subunit 3 [Acidimicrobiia bacterium]|nr:cytochrome c oxidase subunit 3 [Acidimicrobiia bacterium]